ncbi:tRNA guanosine-2'-O-methyltransferase [Aulographum hederae CBS 113979]|uniref:tRNA (guanine(10)-N(2))-methyltransferase n=1 Tax=Aulographum hederae CBS 113979 TaxID=1176131 RepID=A0A6G1H5T0_9PEZI|nr:tRNA guanosine-2'-O-methyltransferase [Aulographum hederae CBS 113979]
MKDYLVRLVQVHDTFRVPELEALAEMAGVELEVVKYANDSPYCTIRLPSTAAASALISRSILGSAIYELWGSGTTYDDLHDSVKSRTQELWLLYKSVSFRFSVDTFQGKRSTSAQREIIESFSYVGFDGPIKMNNPEEEFVVFEEYGFRAPDPHKFYFGRLIATSARDVVQKYDLKKRRYISTTSMDSELALITANLVLAAPGKLFYDPFVGTGSFPIATAHFGAKALGSDLDGRSIRGTKDRNVLSNFEQYGLNGSWVDGFVADLTNVPLRIGKGRWLDGVVCDPPYGVREGLKVLGKEGVGTEPVYVDGILAHLEGYIPPKRAYSFEAMLGDILDFATATLVDRGRLAMWMPTANDEDIDLAIPSHPCLKLVSVCVQPFNKWSRRLLIYRRIPDSKVDGEAAAVRKKRVVGCGLKADDLNAFRKKYFQGFKEQNPNLEDGGGEK